MTSKATRRARKRNRSISLAGGQSAPQPATQGKRRDLEQETPVALLARVRILGLTGKDAMQDAKSPLAGCSVGQRLLSHQTTEAARADLWQAVCHMRRVWTAYDRAIGAPARHAKCLRILAPVDAMTTDGVTFDDRSPEERARSAVSAWMQIQGWLDHVDRPARSAAIIAVVDDAGLTNWPGILRALQCVSEGIKGQRITPRFDGSVSV